MAIALLLLCFPASAFPARALQAPPDSAALHDEARAAQAEFERLRRRDLPVSRSWPGGGSCDEVVGRICLRHAEGGDWYPEPEAERTRELRASLLDVLKRTGKALPGDGWILGQRIFYMVEAGRVAEAVLLARRCAAPPWWCRALEGYALHRDGRFRDAADAFRAALATMDAERARQWRDPAVLLDGAGRDALEDPASEAARAAAVRLLWGLADPLYLAPGNDRWTAHLARHVVAAIREDARSPWTLPWGDDMAELAMRYGWEVGWERQAQGASALAARPGVVGHHDPEMRVYIPTGGALRDPASSPREAWGTGRQGARSGHTPPYAPVTLPGGGQIAVFPRGDRFVVVGSQTLPADTTYHEAHHHALRDVVPERWRGLPPRIGLFLVPLGATSADSGSAGYSSAADTPAGEPDPPPGGPPGLLRVVDTGAAGGALLIEAPVGGYVVSLETWDPALRRAGRVREGVVVEAAPPDVPTLSDLLLLESVGEEGETLREASGRALTREWLRVGEPLVIGWEVYGLGWLPETLAYRLSVRDDGGNLLERAGRWLGLVGDAPARALAWREAGPSTPGPHFRSTALELPEAGPGTYTVRLELAMAGRTTLVTERRVEVREAGEG